MRHCVLSKGELLLTEGFLDSFVPVIRFKKEASLSAGAGKPTAVSLWTGWAANGLLMSIERGLSSIGMFCDR